MMQEGGGSFSVPGSGPTPVEPAASIYDASYVPGGPPAAETYDY
eukprot:COSAG03_NODE_22024_length_296_cov_0.791878_1_plen_43_part_10